jgi:ligand-binding sensor domain-containing protein/putative methionine-R-sulfoxide reductase with GAF domain/anti-sigma regulatory factor (Ser/Thr protein kinase)
MALLHKRISSLCIIALLLIPQWAAGQFFFRNMHTREGLSSREVNCTYKDDQGFIWFGTPNGINRYDGSHIKFINSHSREYPGLIDASVNAITGFGSDNVWVATRSGVCYLDKKKNRFVKVDVFDKQGKMLKDIFCSGFLKDGHGRLWITCYEGLYRLDDSVFRPASTFYRNPLVDSIGCIQGDYETDTIRHAFWVGTCLGLIYFNYDTGEVFGTFNNPRDLRIFDKDFVYSLALDSKGKIWMSSVKHGLISYDYNTDSMAVIKHLGNKAPNSTSQGCHTLFIDSRDRLWISMNYLKAFILLPDGTVHDFTTDLVPDQSLAYGLFHDVYEDPSHNIWVSTVNGVSILSANNYIENLIRLPSSLGDVPFPWAAITDIQPGPGRNLWICKYDGLYLLDPVTHETVRYAPFSDPSLTHHKGQSKGNAMFSVKQIDDDWWCASGVGVQLLNLHTGRFHPFSHYAQGTDLSRGAIYWVEKDKTGKVWFSLWSDGIYCHDTVTKRTFHIAVPGYGDQGNTSSLFFYQDIHENIWLSYGDDGVRIYDPGTNTLKNPFGARRDGLFRQVIYHMTGDSKGHKYLATSFNGILEVDEKNQIVDSFTTHNGLLTNKINFLYCESNGRLWAVTSEGVQFKHPSDDYFSKVPLDLGTPLRNSWSVMYVRDDKMYVSYNDYLATIDLKKIQSDYPIVPPLISSVHVFDRELPFADPSGRLDLKYKENYFTISFSSPLHDDIPNLQYAYKLEGYDRDWIHCGRRQIATYTRVPDGNYKFLVRSTDGNGKWMQNAREFSIVIAHPFWKTWWFILLVAAVLSAIALELWRRRKAYLRKRSISNTIEYFANSVYGNNSVSEICWDIARNCIARLKFEDCVVYLADENSSTLKQIAAYGPKNPTGHEIINPISIPFGEGIVGAVAVSGQPLIINDTTADPRYIVDDERRMSELTVPILHEGKVIGVIDSEHRRKEFFNQDHIKAVSTIASISATKIAEATSEAAARENELQLLQIRKLLAESQLMALRTQMNPHFVFNCLNSIQECIVTNKYGEASMYLNKFSKLFRNVLSNSDKKFVSLADECDVLRLYLELEHMRFEHGFEYEIIADEDLEMNEIMIPGMLVQPFVENALWHGLMHKGSDRRLRIQFAQVSDDVFQCIIDDNGIGRRRSAEIKKQQSNAKKHESKGMGIALDRVALIQRQGFHASLNIIDKTNDSGNAEGTRVVIELSSFLS